MDGETKSCTVFDVSGLTEVKMKRFRGWQGSYYVDHEDKCIAKTCTMCKKIIGAEGFRKDSRHKTRLTVYCKECLRQKAEDRMGRSDEEILKDRETLRPNGTKWCSDCDTTYALDMFYRSRDNRDGLQDSCKECHRRSNDKLKWKKPTYNKNYIDRLKDRTPSQVAMDADSLHPSGHKDCVKCSVSLPLGDFYPNLRRIDGLRDMCRNCDKETNRVKRLKPHVDYWKYMDIPLECYVCGGTWKIPDHVVPEKLGGLDASFNRLPICEKCNLSKWSHPLDEWLYRTHPDIAEAVLHKVTVTYRINI